MRRLIMIAFMATAILCLSLSVVYGGSAPTCQVTPTTLNFGTVAVGAEKDTTFTIKNVGTGQLQGTVSEACDHYSIISGAGSYKLSANQTVTVTVRFAPTSAGVKTCNIDTGTSCTAVACTGTGQLAPSCQVSPTSLDFGTVTVGGSNDKTFTITNTGGGTLAGTVSEACVEYSIVSGGGAYSLTAGQWVTVTVRLAPTSSGTKTCTVATGGTCATVACTGVGELAPECQVDPTTLDFDAVTVGDHADLGFTITNAGEGTLSGTVSEACADYDIVSGGGAYSLTAGQWVTVTVRFAPTSSGTKTCTITTGGTCATVACTGVGELAPECQVDPTTLDFDAVTVGDHADLGFTMTNTGEGTLSGTVSEACADYDIVSGGGAYSLTAGQWVTVTVRFAPTSSGTKTCTIATGGTCATVACTGVGELAPECQVDPTTLDFDAVTVGDHADLGFTITNAGEGTLSGTVSEACADYDIVSGGGAYSLTAGQWVTVTVRFAPTSSGTKTCTITTGGTCATVACTGVGELAPECQVDPTTLDFDAVTVGDHADLGFTITNTGEGTLSGSITEGCVDYEIVSGGGDYSLSAGQSIATTIRFTPTGVGTRTCMIETGASCSTVSCTGVGEAATECEVAPISWDFGEVLLGGHSDMTFVLKNIGGGTLAGSVDESCTEFAILSGGGAYSLGGGESDTVTVRFEPVSAGTKVCLVTVGSPACSDVSLTGLGREPVGTESSTWGRIKAMFGK